MSFHEKTKYMTNSLKNRKFHEHISFLVAIQTRWRVALKLMSHPTDKGRTKLIGFPSVPNIVSTSHSNNK